MILKDTPYAWHTLRLSWWVETQCSTLLMLNNFSEGFAFVIVDASRDAVGARLCFIPLTPFHHVNSSVPTEAVVFETRSAGVPFGSKSLTLLKVAASALNGGVKVLPLQSPFDYG